MTSHSFFFLSFFFNVYSIFERERDRARAGEGQREKETQNPKKVPGSKPSAQSPTWGLNPQTVRSWPEPSRTLNWLSHPGAPAYHSLLHLWPHLSGRLDQAWFLTFASLFIRIAFTANYQCVIGCFSAILCLGLTELCPCTSEKALELRNAVHCKHHKPRKKASHREPWGFGWNTRPEHPLEVSVIFVPSGSILFWVRATTLGSFYAAVNRFHFCLLFGHFGRFYCDLRSFLSQVRYQNILTTGRVLLFNST